MAWKIAIADGVGGLGARPGKPFTFLQAAGFQWVNPKAWVMAVGAITAYTSTSGYFYLEIALIALTFFVALHTVHFHLDAVRRRYRADFDREKMA